MKRLFLLLSIFILIIFFQNCSDIGVIKFSDLSSNSSSESPSETDSGNGTGYGGKPGGTFYHYIPGYQCAGHESAFAKIDYNPETADSVYTQSKTQQCLSLPQNIPNQNLDLGNLQNRVIGYEENIFEAALTEPTIIPENLVEIWCVDQWLKPNIEVLSTYNIKQKQAQTDFYFPGQAKRTEVNPARTTSLLTAHLTSSYFNLIINKSSSGTKAGTFEGKLTLSGNNGENQQKLLQCRLGGYLDARLWPALAVNYDSYQQVEWNTNENQFYISAGYSGISPWSENRFFSYNPNTNTYLGLVSEVEKSVGVKNFKFTPDRSKVILTAQLAGDVTYQLYSKSPSDLTPPMLLNNKLVDIGQGVSGEVNISSDSKYIYYLDGAQEQGLDIETWLRMVDLSSGMIRQINHTIPTAGDAGIVNYDIAYSLNKVVYSVGFTYIDVWISDLFGLNNRKLDLSKVLGINTASLYGGTKFYLPWHIKSTNHWVLKNERYLVLVATEAFSNNSNLLFVVDLSTEKVVYTKQFSSYLSLQDVNNLPVIKVYSSVLASTSISYLNLNNFMFLSEQELINTFKTSSVVQEQQAVLKMEFSLTKNLCLSNSQSSILQVFIDTSNWLIINKDSSTNINIVYLYNTDLKSCREINRLSEFTSKGTQLASISPDKKNILLTSGGKLFIIPSDNRPIVEIYNALNKFPFYDQIGFIDNRKIFFRGRLIKDSWNQLFIWEIPTAMVPSE